MISSFGGWRGVKIVRCWRKDSSYEMVGAGQIGSVTRACAVDALMDMSGRGRLRVCVTVNFSI